ncbi:MAG: class I SAM-dependent methyltransferase [bacterium]|nr:class I SAM-dependent methyltransferase [bacterium]
MECNSKYNRLIRPSDFDAPGFMSNVREATAGKTFPCKLHKKMWENGRVFQVLQEFGYLERNKTAVGLGSFNEILPFVLSNYLEHVYRTDYFQGDNMWTKENETIIAETVPSFLPEGMPHDAARVSFMEMDGTDMTPFENESVDIVYSISAIEHFGNRNKAPHGAVKCMQESERILKPGGICLGTTEFQLNDVKHAQYFREEDFRGEMLESHNMKPLEPFEFSLDTAMAKPAYFLPHVLKDVLGDDLVLEDSTLAMITRGNLVLIPIFFAFIKH